ncbi:MAG: hypothetical protein HOE44_18700 [Candidatus Marinimicrobia bacterium]|jgi:hypothetical protein|nr:hypothetical protein [Candidatus Neomarinimicrobiota bacterium]
MDLKITTLGSLLTVDKKSPAELAELIRGNGIYFKDRFEVWRAAQPNADDAKAEAIIEAALDAVAEWCSVHNSPDPAAAEEYWRYPDHQPIDEYGFHVDGSGNFTVGDSLTQRYEEKIADLEAQLDSSSSPAKDDSLRAVAVHAWMKCGNPLSSRQNLWDSMNLIDPIIFQAKHVPDKEDKKGSKKKAIKAIKAAVDRVNAAHKERYGVKLSFSK